MSWEKAWPSELKHPNLTKLQNVPFKVLSIEFQNGSVQRTLESGLCKLGSLSAKLLILGTNIAVVQKHLTYHVLRGRPTFFMCREQL